MRSIECKHLTLNFRSVAARKSMAERLQKSKRRLGEAEGHLASVEGEAERTAHKLRPRGREAVVALSRRVSAVPTAQEKPEILRAPSPVSIMRGPWEE